MHGRGGWNFDSAWEDYYISVGILLKKYERLFAGMRTLCLEMPFRDLFSPCPIFVSSSRDHQRPDDDDNTKAPPLVITFKSM